MPLLPSTDRYAILVLRIGVSVLFLWFGFSQIFSPGSWVSWVPAWASSITHLDTRVIVLLNGGFELFGGILLAFGVLTRVIALLLGLHLLLIVWEIGYDAIAVRDLAIAISALALSLFTPDEWVLDRRL